MSCRRAVAVAATLLAGCAFKNPGARDAGPGDALGDALGPDAPPQEPCTLPAITLAVATLSGCETAGTADGPRETARFANPVNVAVAPSGLAYVADFDSNRIRKVDLAGKVSTVLLQPTFQRPFGIAFGGDGFLYVETDDDDQGRHGDTTGTIWKVNPASGAATVLARDIGRPRGIAYLPGGQLALADQAHHVVELLDPSTGLVTLLAGTLDVPGYANGRGAAALFAQPYDLVVLDGDLVVTELDNHRLRRVALTGDVSDFAGTGVDGDADGPLASATFSQLKGATIDLSGAIYVTDAGNHDIRMIANGMVTHVAGSTAGWHDDDDPSLAQFYGIEGLDITADGTRLVVADGNNGDGMPFNHIRVLHR